MKAFIGFIMEQISRCPEYLGDLAIKSVVVIRDRMRNRKAAGAAFLGCGALVTSLVVVPIAAAKLAPWPASPAESKPNLPAMASESTSKNTEISESKQGGNIDLARMYPTTLNEGDTQPGRARDWQFHQDDIFMLEKFSLQVANAMKIDCKEADLGVGHCADGAVWAVVIPKDKGTLQSKVNANPEEITHIWLRFHPQKIASLFPQKTILKSGNTNQYALMQRIAMTKMTSSWQAGGKAMIPSPSDMTVDAETTEPVRRFFMVNLSKETAEYVNAFEKRTIKTAKSVTAQEAETVLVKMWEAFDRQYAMFILRPEVNWNQLKEEFLPRVQKCKTNVELAATLADMLKNLRDLHVWLTVNDESIPVFNRPRKANANPNALTTILGNTKRINRKIEWTVTGDHVGYIAIYGWDNAEQADQLDEVLEKMRNTRGMIIDVRLNGGGSEPVAQQFAARFLTKEHVYSYSQYRNGPKHSDLSSKNPRKVNPEGPWRYDRPVVLLIGEKCMSSNESFIAMMQGNELATTFGSRTCGSSGNPTIVKLPCDITVSVPRWIDYLSDGTPLDERGIKPNIAFNAEDEAFSGNRDDLLEAAVAMMKSQPLPDNPIKGPSAKEEIEEANSNAPKAVFVSPQQKADDVAHNQEIRIRFNQPMKSRDIRLDWQSGGFILNGMPRYDTAQNEFKIPVFLQPGILHKVAVNFDPFREMQSRRTPRFAVPRQNGFMGIDGSPANELRWEFYTMLIEKKVDATPLRVLSVTPATGETTSIMTLLDVTFDQSIMQPMLITPHFSGEFGKDGDYHAVLPPSSIDSSSKRITLPLILNSNQETELEIGGFWSAKGVKADPIKIRLKTDTNQYSARHLEEFAQAARDPKLEALLNKMKTARQQISSLSETVQFILLFGSKGVYTRLSSCEATFKFQGSNQFYGDITGPMQSTEAFKLGSDGQSCWLYSAIDGKKKLKKSPQSDIKKQAVNLADPFDLYKDSISSAISRMHLMYQGKKSLDGNECEFVRGWEVESFAKSWSGSMFEWWIDSKTFLPRQLIVYSNFGCQIYCFNFEQLNQALPASAFQPPQDHDIIQDAFQKEPGCDQEFFQLGDGSNGHMTGRMGLFGNKKRISSGLN